MSQEAPPVRKNARGSVTYNSYGYIQKGVTTDISPFYVISSETWTDVYFPKQLPNGQLDGIYEIMESSL